MVVVVFLVCLLLGAISIFIATGLFYAFWYYYKKSQKLQKQLEGLNAAKTEPQATSSFPEDVPPPPSTDD
jgi:hypothetical protein